MNNLVAVYGTLRQGHGNHRCMERAQGVFKFKGHTKENFNMYSLGGFPIVSMAHSSHEQSVVVEVYQASDEGVTGPLDTLEGYPHFYNRTQIDVVDGEGNVTEGVWMYHIDEEQRSPIKSGDWNDQV